MADNNFVRVTKAQKFEVIKRFIKEDAIHTFPGTTDKNGNIAKQDYVFDYDAIIAFLDAEIAALAKKNSGDKKQTDQQKANEKIKEAICDYLAALGVDKDNEPIGATCTQVAKDVLSIHCPDEATPQKASGMFRLLKNDGMVDTKEIKGKTYFYLL